MLRLSQKEKRELKLKERSMMTPNELIRFMEEHDFPVVEIYIYGTEAHKIKDAMGRIPDIDGDTMIVTRDSFSRFNEIEMGCVIDMNIIGVARRLSPKKIHDNPKSNDHLLPELKAKNPRAVIRCGDKLEMNQVADSINLQLKEFRSCGLIVGTSETCGYNVYIFTDPECESSVPFLTIDFSKINKFNPCTTDAEPILYPELKVIVFGNDKYSMDIARNSFHNDMKGNQYYVESDIVINDSETFARCVNTNVDVDDQFADGNNAYLWFCTEESLQNFNSSIILKFRNSCVDINKRR